VQQPQPVVGHATGRAGYGLADRVLLRRRQGRPLAELLGPVVVEPVLAGLEAVDDRVPGVGGVVAGMLRGRRVTAPDVAALRASPEMKPPPVGGVETVHAPRAARRDRHINAVHGQRALGCEEEWRRASNSATAKKAKLPTRAAQPQGAGRADAYSANTIDATPITARAMAAAHAAGR
jgi:hypothetical protein